VTCAHVAEGRGWTLYLGDCLDVLPALERVDQVLCDPPYEAEAHTLQRRVKRSGSVLSVEPLDFPPITEDERARFSIQAGRLAKRWTIVFCQVEGSQRWRACLEAAGLVYRRTCAWVKPDAQPQLSGDRPAMGYESLVCAHVPGRSRWNGHGRTGVFTHVKYEGGGRRNDHPTQKPVALMLELVGLFTDPGETVLDPFAGSATTGVACLRLGRRFVGVEKNVRYFELACERLRAEELGSTLDAARVGQLPLLGGTR
jgi:DNA modification methylase